MGIFVLTFSKFIAIQRRKPHAQSMRVIRLVLADDVNDLRRLVRLQLSGDPRLEVVGEAADGQDAVAQSALL